MLKPSEVRVAPRWCSILPTRILLQLFIPPFGNIEWRVRHYVVGTEIGVLVASEAVCWLLAEIEVHSPNCKIHRHQPPCCWITFLTIDRDVTKATAMTLYELFRLHEHSTRSAARVENLSRMRSQHLYKYAYDRSGCPI